MPDYAYVSNSFSEILKQKMNEEGWNQSQLSKSSGVSQPQISRMLSGKTKRLSRTMEKLCKYADLSVPLAKIDRSQNKAIQDEIQKLLEASPQKIETIISLLKATSALAAKSESEPDSSVRQS